MLLAPPLCERQSLAGCFEAQGVCKSIKSFHCCQDSPTSSFCGISSYLFKGFELLERYLIRTGPAYVIATQKLALVPRFVPCNYLQQIDLVDASATGMTSEFQSLTAACIRSRYTNYCMPLTQSDAGPTKVGPLKHAFNAYGLLRRHGPSIGSMGIRKCK